MKENSSHSSSSIIDAGGHGSVLCRCGLVAPLKISSTDSNPQRRFFGCSKWNEKSKHKSCNFFLWYDPPTCRRGMEVTPLLTEKIKALQSENSNMKITMKRLKYMCGLLWITIVLMVVLRVKSSML